MAHPYASGVTNQTGTISWVLNESATDVKIVFDNGHLTNDLGSAPVPGTNTFSLGSHTNFSVVVYKIGSNVLTQISSDNNLYNDFYGPRGVAVNKNARTWNFGRIYVANANPGSASSIRTSTTKGIYALDAASEDCLGLGNTAATANMTFGGSTVYSPFRLFVGPDDTLYVGDAGSGKIGGVWGVDPNLLNSTNFFGLATPTTNTLTKSTNFGRVIGTPNVTGSMAQSNLVLTLTGWDLNLVNPAGTHPATTNNYQDIYQYRIGSGPLPWAGYPTVITNPIGLGQINAVLEDMETAPDGKYFLVTTRSSPSDGNTNLCVLSSNGVTLWDSKSQSAAFFGDSVNDHVSINDTSVAISPDDKFVLIQGVANNNFLMMALTNGVPDISTLTTNTSVGTGGGSSCYSSTWDAADNIYVTSGGSDTLRIFSPGYTTTCVTSNDATCTNGSFHLTAISGAIAIIQTQPSNQMAQCSGGASFSVVAGGVDLAYQWYLNGAGLIIGATNANLLLSNLSLSASGQVYTVVVSNAVNTVTSQPAILTVVDTIPPVITLNGNAVSNVLQGAPFTDPSATAYDACAGILPVTTNGSVNVNVTGVYLLYYSAADGSGNATTNVRTVNVQSTNGPPVIVQQPSNQITFCTSSVTLSVFAAGVQPMSYQWFQAGAPLSDGTVYSGSATANLTINSALMAQAGNYTVTVSNALGSVTSQSAIVTVNDQTPPTLTLNGSAVIRLAQGASYLELGAVASDACVGNLAVSTSGSVNVNISGTYVVTYTAMNSGGVTASHQRTVIVTPAPGPITTPGASLIPLPVTLQNRTGVFVLCPAQTSPVAPATALVNILVDNSSLATGQYLAAALAKSTGYQFRVTVSTATNAVREAILITSSNAISTLNAEGYELTVAPDSVVIRAPASAGGFYGVQSLLQLLPPQIYASRIVPGVAWVAPCVYIQDQPRFSWRGAMVDVARHFIDKQQIKQVIDSLAAHKLNALHLHLADDNGWRIEITNYPALTSNSAFRASLDYGLNPRSNPNTNAAGQYGGFYTQADIRELVAYAQQRHMTILPEIEMPCHSTAGLAAYPQFGCGNPASDYDMDYDNINYSVDLYSPGTPGTYAFLEEVLTEVMALFPCPYIHCGGDEVTSSGDTQWNTYNADKTNMTALGITPNGTTSIIAYQRCFSTNIANFIQSKGRLMMGWDDIEFGGLITNTAVDSAETGSSSYAVAAAEAGMPVIMSPSTACYINYIETTTNIEPPFVVGGAPSYTSLSTVYNYEPVPTNLPAAYTNNILGAQCNLWSEYVPSFENFLFKLYPRMCAMAEVTWSAKAARNYASFTNRLVVQEQRLAQMGVNYNHESIPQAGKWGPSVSTTPTTYAWDITTNVAAAGEIDVNFWYTSGSSLAISSVTLLQNGVPVDADVHAGLAGSGATYASEPFVPIYTLYVLHLPETKPGATYTIQAVIAGSGGTSTSGIVYLPNWN